MKSLRAKTRDHSPVLQAETIHFHQAAGTWAAGTRAAGTRAAGTRAARTSRLRERAGSGLAPVLLLGGLGITMVVLTVLGALFVVTR